VLLLLPPSGAAATMSSKKAGPAPCARVVPSDQWTFTVQGVAPKAFSVASVYPAVMPIVPRLCTLMVTVRKYRK
jgi:hypothetical protein